MTKLCLIITFAVLTFSNCQSRAAEALDIDKDNPQHRNSLMFDLPVRVLEMPPVTEDEKQEKLVARDWEHRDILAQESMAKSTYKILFWSVVQLIFTATGTAALIYSLLLNRRATNAAIDVVKAERAWILYKDIAVNPFFGDAAEPNRLTKWVLTIRWRNGGRSPATDVVFASCIKFAGAGAPPPEFKLDSENKDGFTSSLGQEAETNGMPIDIRAEEYRDVLNNKRDLFVYGKVQYRDVYSSHIIRHTEFCYRVKFPALYDQNGFLVPIVRTETVGQNSIS